MSKVLIFLFILLLSSCATINNLSSERRDQLEFRAFSDKSASTLRKEREIVDADIAACYRGEIDKTLKKLRKQVSATETNKWPLWSKMAGCHFLEGEENLAIYYNQLILKDFSRKKISKAFPYNNMGVIFFEKDMPEQAESYFLQARRIDPNSISIQYNLSSLYMHYGEFNKAMPIFRKRMSDVYKDRELFYSYALALTYQGHFKTLAREFKNFRGEMKNFDKLELLKALQYFITGKRKVAYKVVKNIKGRYLSSVEEKARDKIIDVVEEELAAEAKKKEKKNEK